MARRPARRVQRTQELIRSAFRSLLEEKGFEALTVQQIIDRANVGRATFYAHFDSKDELFASGFDELRSSLTARRRAAARIVGRAHGMNGQEYVLDQVFDVLGPRSGAPGGAHKG